MLFSKIFLLHRSIQYSATIIIVSRTIQSLSDDIQIVSVSLERLNSYMVEGLSHIAQKVNTLKVCSLDNHTMCLLLLSILCMWLCPWVWLCVGICDEKG